MESYEIASKSTMPSFSVEKLANTIKKQSGVVNLDEKYQLLRSRASVSKQKFNNQMKYILEKYTPSINDQPKPEIKTAQIKSLDEVKKTIIDNINNINKLGTLEKELNHIKEAITNNCTTITETIETANILSELAIEQKIMINNLIDECSKEFQNLSNSIHSLNSNLVAKYDEIKNQTLNLSAENINFLKQYVTDIINEREKNNNNQELTLSMPYYQKIGHLENNIQFILNLLGYKNNESNSKLNEQLCKINILDNKISDVQASINKLDNKGLNPIQLIQLKEMIQDENKKVTEKLNDTYKEKYLDIKNYVDIKFNAVQKEIDDTKNNFAQVNSNYETIDNKIQKMENNLENITEYVRNSLIQIKNNAEDQEMRIKENSENLTRHLGSFQKIEVIEKTVKELNNVEEITKVWEKFEQLEHKIQIYQKNDVQMEIPQIKNLISEKNVLIENEIKQIKQHLKLLKDSYINIEKSREEIRTIEQFVQKSIEDLKEDISNTKSNKADPGKKAEVIISNLKQKREYEEKINEILKKLNEKNDDEIFKRFEEIQKIKISEEITKCMDQIKTFINKEILKNNEDNIEKFRNLINSFDFDNKIKELVDSNIKQINENILNQNNSINEKVQYLLNFKSNEQNIFNQITKECKELLTSEISEMKDQINNILTGFQSLEKNINTNSQNFNEIIIEDKEEYNNEKQELVDDDKKSEILNDGDNSPSGSSSSSKNDDDYNRDDTPKNSNKEKTRREIKDDDIISEEEDDMKNNSNYPNIIQYPGNDANTGKNNKKIEKDNKNQDKNNTTNNNQNKKANQIPHDSDKRSKKSGSGNGSDSDDNNSRKNPDSKKFFDDSSVDNEKKKENKKRKENNMINMDELLKFLEHKLKEMKNELKDDIKRSMEAMKQKEIIPSDAISPTIGKKFTIALKDNFVKLFIENSEEYIKETESSIPLLLEEIGGSTITKRKFKFIRNGNIVTSFLTNKLNEILERTCKLEITSTDISNIKSFKLYIENELLYLEEFTPNENDIRSNSKYIISKIKDELFYRPTFPPSIEIIPTTKKIIPPSHKNYNNYNRKRGFIRDRYRYNQRNTSMKSNSYSYKNGNIINNNINQLTRSVNQLTDTMNEKSNNNPYRNRNVLYYRNKNSKNSQNFTRNFSKFRKK